MRVLGLDVGARRIGVALSDALGLTAQGLTVLHCRGLTADVNAVRELVAQHGVSTIVVGLPFTLAGERGTQVARVEAFMKAMRRRITVPIEGVDERLSTLESERVLLSADVSRRKRKQVIDQLAAQIILQRYLESRRHERPGGQGVRSS